MRQTEIDEYTDFDHSNQDKRERNTLFHEQNDEEYCNNRYSGHDSKIVSRRFNHILHTRCFADQHAVFIVFFKDSVKLVNLLIYIITCCFVFRVDK